MIILGPNELKLVIHEAENFILQDFTSLYTFKYVFDIDSAEKSLIKTQRND